MKNRPDFRSISGRNAGFSTFCPGIKLFSGRIGDGSVHEQVLAAGGTTDFCELIEIAAKGGEFRDVVG